MDPKKKIKELPDTPGVYIMKDFKSQVLYVGKAIDLRKRVSSYFRRSARHVDRIASMVSQVEDISYIPTQTEAEALIYENSLIKQFSPKYNVALKDGKSYPLLKLTTNEKFPRLIVTRERADDGATYYGPFSNATLLRKAVIIMKRVFPLRLCRKMPKSVCLYYHIGQCLGPCEGKIDEAGYESLVSELKLFLSGKKKELIDLLSLKMRDAAAGQNYEEAARTRDRIEALGSVRSDRVSYGPRNELGELADILGLKSSLDTIETFDISNIMGTAAVGSMISFVKGKPNKDGYRKFKIRSVEGIDDYGMMREVISRRYKRLIRDKGRLPDLILIDGGKGHLSAALEVLDSLNIGNIPVIGIAKEFEHIFTKHKSEPIVLPGESKALHLLKRMRDEAHRFAITYHKSLMSRMVECSELDGIAGIGPKRKKALVNHFGSVDALSRATQDEIAKVKGMNHRSAKSVIEHFKGREESL
jgi:excinuclease ABC subunit C